MGYGKSLVSDASHIRCDPVSQLAPIQAPYQRKRPEPAGHGSITAPTHDAPWIN